MECEEVSNFMGIINNTKNLLREEREVWAEELKAMEKRYEREILREGFPEKERERLKSRIKDARHLVEYYDMVLFRMIGIHSDLETAKVYLNKLSNNY